MAQVFRHSIAGEVGGQYEAQNSNRQIEQPGTQSDSGDDEVLLPQDLELTMALRLKVRRTDPSAKYRTSIPADIEEG